MTALARSRSRFAHERVEIVRIQAAVAVLEHEDLDGGHALEHLADGGLEVEALAATIEGPPRR
jgi:intracellular sulfur oxidation DsrE/DsrF family protein